MKDLVTGIFVFALVAFMISYFSPLNFAEAFGFVFLGVLVKNVFDEFRNNNG